MEHARVFWARINRIQGPVKTEILTLKHISIIMVLRLSRIKQNGTSTLYCLKECVFDPAHTSNEAAIVNYLRRQKLFYQCFHESCKDRRWADAREKISGADSLKPFMPNSNGNVLLSNSLHIYREDRKDRKTIKDYQGFTGGGYSRLSGQRQNIF